MAEDEHVRLGRTELGDDPIDPPAHVLGALTSRRPVPPERPTRALGADLGRRPAVVLAVVPLHQLFAPLGDPTEARELARLTGTAQRAGQHEAEAALAERLADEPSLLLGPPRPTADRCARCAGACASTRSRRAGRARPPSLPRPDRPVLEEELSPYGTESLCSGSISGNAWTARYHESARAIVPRR